MANLEPLEEKDLNLKEKFGASSEKPSLKENLGGLAAATEKERAREVVSAEKDNAYGKILSKIQSQKDQDTDSETVRNDAQNVYQKNDAESQIQHLVDIALTKGVLHAVRVARHLEDNYVLDMFHDKLLADELHDALMEKGLIKEI